MDVIVAAGVGYAAQTIRIDGYSMTVRQHFPTTFGQMKIRPDIAAVEQYHQRLSRQPPDQAPRRRPEHKTDGIHVILVRIARGIDPIYIP